MWSSWILIIIGIWIASLSFMGFPPFWDTVMFVFLGLAVTVIGVREARRWSMSVQEQPLDFDEKKGE
jgi:hypothetical protein